MNKNLALFPDRFVQIPKQSRRPLACPFSKKPVLFLLACVLTIPFSPAKGQSTIITDNFSNGVTPMWHFIDTNSAGAPWNIALDNATGAPSFVPMVPDGTTPPPPSQAIQQFDPRTVVVKGDYIQFEIKFRTPSSQATSPNKFTLSMLNTPSSLEGNIFGYTANPLTNCNGYTFSQAYNSATPGFAKVTNNVSSVVGWSYPAAALLGAGQLNDVVIRLTSIASLSGYTVTATINGVSVLNFPDPTPSTTTFDTLLIDGGGVPLNIDSVVVTTSLPSTTFNFTLPHAYITSAGVYNSSNVMVRELWKKFPLAAGTYTESWGNTDDGGNIVPAGNYTIKVLYHNMNYIWDGLIGDTSSSFDGLNTYRSLGPASGMSIDYKGDGFVSYAYNEGLPGIYSFNTNSPQTPSFGVAADQNTIYTHVATDGNHFYLANTGSFWDAYNNSFVTVRDMATGTNSEFSTSTPGVVTATVGNLNNGVIQHTYNYPGVIDETAETNTPPAFDPSYIQAHQATGIAVQKDPGIVLAVSHGASNCVKLFHKTTGALLNTIYSVAGAGPLAFDRNGDLWVLSGTSGLHYNNIPTAANPTAVPAPVLPSITGLTAPLAIAVMPTASLNLVAVADGGSSQQVKYYNFSGVQQTIFTLGKPGGYPLLGPDASTKKFWFWDLRDKIPSTFLAFQPDLSLWVGDTANDRALHYKWIAPNTPETYENQIATIPAFYQMSVDPNNPSRVFTGNLEYNVSYTTNLTPGDPSDPNDSMSHGNGCWTLVKNWYGGTYSGAFTNYQGYSPFSNVVTLGGHTYAVATYENTNVNPQNPKELFEFPINAETPARQTPATGGYLNGNNIQADGTVRWAIPVNTSGSAPNYTYTQNINEQAPPTINPSTGNPWWGATNVVASPTCHESSTGSYYGNSQYDPSAHGGWGMGVVIPKTSSGNYIMYDAPASSFNSNSTWPKPIVNTNCFVTYTQPNTHLGAVTNNATTFLWTNSPGYLQLTNAFPGYVNTEPDGLGTFNDANGYGGHDGIAVFASTNARDVIAGYDGQYGPYSNQWMHYYDDGLFVGQFGTIPGQHADARGLNSVPGCAGNIGQANFVNYHGTNYVYCSDESIHAGIHRWRLDGTVNELSTTIALNGAAALGTAATWPSTNLVSNPGFESEAATYSLSYGLGYTAIPVGWQVDNGSDGSGAGAFFTQWIDSTGGTTTSAFAHSLPYHATIAKTVASGTTYTVRPYQVFANIPNGIYTLSAWVRTSGTQSTAQMFYKVVPLSTTSNPNDATIPIPSGTAWNQISKIVTVSGGQAEIGFLVTGTTGDWLDIDDVVFSQ